MKKITDLKTFENACKVLNLDAKKVIPDFSGYPEKDRKAMIAHAKLVIIARAVNTIENDGKEWVPDWTNGNWDKYYPWFTMGSPSGGGFSYYDFGVWVSFSHAGSRLCFKSYEAAEYVGKQFEELYKAYFVM